MQNKSTGAFKKVRLQKDQPCTPVFVTAPLPEYHDFEMMLINAVLNIS